MKYRTMEEVYDNMIRSCYDKKCTLYSSFGKQGIRVCDEWLIRENFFEWCEIQGWEKGMKVGRKGKDLDYSPENCYLFSYDSSLEIRMKDIYMVVCGSKLSDHPLYSTYLGIISRCYSKNDENYPDYGARGIVVCDEWKGKYGPIKFIIWSLEHGWEPGLTIDRIDFNGNYEPSNCRWVDLAIQAINRRGVKLYEYEGKMLTIRQISIASGISMSRMYKLINVDNKSLEEAIDIIKNNPVVSKVYTENPNEPIYKKNGKINFAGVERRYGVCGDSVKKLVDKGMDLVDAVEKVKSRRTPK